LPAQIFAVVLLLFKGVEVILATVGATTITAPRRMKITIRARVKLFISNKKSIQI